MSIKLKDLVAHIAWLSKEAPACSSTRLSHYHESLKSQQDNLDLPFDSLQSFFFFPSSFCGFLRVKIVKKMIILPYLQLGLWSFKDQQKLHCSRKTILGVRRLYLSSAWPTVCNLSGFHFSLLSRDIVICSQSYFKNLLEPSTHNTWH